MTITIYFDDPHKMGYPFNNAKYYESYKAFASLCRSKDIELYFARGKDSYNDDMKFNNGFYFKNDELTYRSTPYKTDRVFLKGHDVSFDENDSVLNSPTLSNICYDKLETYQQFKKYMAPTYQFNVSNYENVFDKINSDKIVLKPQVGSEGKGIIVTDKKNFDLSVVDLTKPYFVQEFLDSSDGINGLVKGLHDLRLILFNGIVKSSYIRQPKKGSYLANVAQGGSLLFVPVDKLPTSALALAEKIDQKFAEYSPRLYAIDLLYQGETPYLIELNDQPGMPYMEENQYENSADEFHKDLLTILTN